MIFRFGQFVLDTQLHELLDDGQVRPVEPQIFDLLTYLIANRDRLVTRDELFEHVWHGRPVSDATLSSRIKSARQAVGDSGKAQAVIQTAARRGFRFVAPVVEEASPPPEEAAVQPAPESAPAYPELPDRPSIAVLPFSNLSSDPDQEHFADGMVEDVISALAKFDWLFVIARNSSFAYKHRTVDVREVSRELGVRYLLEGSVRRHGVRLRVSAELIDAVTGATLWAERYDRDVEDLFDIQDEITAAIVGSIAPEIGQAEIARARRTPPDNLSAWGLYQRGLAHYPSGTEEGFRCAIEFFDRARAADPGFVDALARAAHMRTRYVLFFTPPDQEAILRTAHELLLEALRLDPGSCTANFALGRWHSANREHDHAVARCRAAVAMNPNSAPAHFELANCLLHSGPDGHRESLREHEHVIRLSPRDAHMSAILTGKAIAHFHLGELDECVDLAQRALRDTSPRFWADAVLCAALSELGRTEEARAAAEALLRKRPETTARHIDRLFGHGSPRVVDALVRAGVPE